MKKHMILCALMGALYMPQVMAESAPNPEAGTLFDGSVAAPVVKKNTTGKTEAQILEENRAKWMKEHPEEFKALEKRREEARKKWDELPEDERRKRAAERWNSLSEEERADVRAKRKAAMSAQDAQREAKRRADLRKQWLALPEEERQKRASERWKKLSADAKAADEAKKAGADKPAKAAEKPAAGKAGQE